MEKSIVYLYPSHGHQPGPSPVTTNVHRRFQSYIVHIPMPSKSCGVQRISSTHLPFQLCTQKESQFNRRMSFTLLAEPGVWPIVPAEGSWPCHPRHSAEVAANNSHVRPPPGSFHSARQMRTVYLTRRAGKKRKDFCLRVLLSPG